MECAVTTSAVLKYCPTTSLKSERMKSMTTEGHELLGEDNKAQLVGMWHTAPVSQSVWRLGCKSALVGKGQTNKSSHEGWGVLEAGIAQARPTLNLLKAMLCSIFQKTSVIYSQHPPPKSHPISPKVQVSKDRYRILVRVPRGDSASHPLLSPRGTRHQPECAPPRRPSPCHS